MSHPQMVIFNPERPVGREAIFKANTQGTAPASVICRDQTDPRGVVEYSQAIAGDSRTALHIEQRRIPSPTELAGEETDGVGLCRGRERRIEQAHARVLDVGPIALSFQSEYKLIGLPAISNLSTGNASGTVTAAARDSPHSSDEIHATVALAPTAVGTDVEPGPVVNRSYHRRGRATRSDRSDQNAGSVWSEPWREAGLQH